MTGIYQGTSEVFHGFIREPNGTFIAVDDPQAGTLAFQGTWPATINDQGDVAGFYFDGSFGVHGFVRSAKGDYTTIDDPNGSGGTMLALEQGLNSRGDVVGWYFAGGVQFGFLRDPDGVYNTVEPSSVSPATLVGGVNSGGATTGWIFTQSRREDGNFQRVWTRRRARNCGVYAECERGNYRSGRGCQRGKPWFCEVRYRLGENV